MTKLTPREIEVLKCIGEKMTSKQIALKLNLSPRTVHMFLENVYFKLNVSGTGARQKAYNIALINKMFD